jgi:hypothetical protein
MAILRIEHPDIYADVSRIPKLPIALQRVYAGDWRHDDDSVFKQEFGDRASFVQDRCLKYYKPASTLATLFSLSFAGEGDRLDHYFAVLGG